MHRKPSLKYFFQLCMDNFQGNGRMPIYESFRALRNCSQKLNGNRYWFLCFLLFWLKITSPIFLGGFISKWCYAWSISDDFIAWFHILWIDSSGKICYIIRREICFYAIIFIRVILWYQNHVFFYNFTI